MASRRLGKVMLKNSSLFLCDMQEKFRPTIQFYPQIIATARRMLDASNILDLPVVVTEQYPKGLGPTVSELDVSQLKVFPKTRFSMLIPDVQEHLKKVGDVKSVILCGIEAHVCITQTVVELIEAGYDVHVVADACSSRSMVDRMFAFQRMKDAGAFLTTSESILLGLCGDAAHPKFREVQKIIWDPAPDSGLLYHTILGETPV